MSVIDRAMREWQVSEREPSIAVSLPEAYAAVLVAAISADGRFGTEEADRLKHVLSTSRWFDGAGQAAEVGLVERALNLLADRGLAPVLAACGARVPEAQRASVFAVATDLVLADGRIDGGEKAFIDQLQAALRVDDATALKIVEVMLIKNGLRPAAPDASWSGVS
jgi:hypothetical protein